MILSTSFLRTVLPSAQLYNPDLEAWFAQHAATDIVPVVDSREVKGGTLFVAIPGQKVDGHDFVDQAIQAGAIAILIEKSKRSYAQNISDEVQKNVLFIAVDDTTSALVAFAKAWRKQFDIPIIGVTGSMGKTTTKEMLRTIFEHAEIPAYVSQGNQNSLIGVSLNILQLTKQHTLAVFEMGINERGEMAQLVEIVQPTTALVTTIAHAHGEGIGSLADIAQEKVKIFSQLPSHAVGVITGDQPMLKRFSYHHKVMTFGFKRGNDLRADQITTSFSLEQMQISCRVICGSERLKLILNTGHKGTLHNALAALAVAAAVGVSLPAAVAALANFKAVAQRFEGKKILGDRGFVINDACNANPETMQGAIQSFDSITTSAPKIAVIGQMFELGARTQYWHARIGKLLAKTGSLSKVILVGAMMREQQRVVGSSVPCIYVDTWEQAHELLLHELDVQPLILLKSSNSVGLVNIAKQLTIK